MRRQPYICELPRCCRPSRAFCQTFLLVCLFGSIGSDLSSNSFLDLGYGESTSTNPMTVPPYAAALALMLIVSYSSDHFKERGRHTAALMVVAVIASALVTLSGSQLRGKHAHLHRCRPCLRHIPTIARLGCQ